MEKSLRLRIGQLASLTGVTTKTIRHYHKIGLLPKPQRGENSYRLYDVSDLYRLRLVLRLKDVGFSLGDIQEILQSENPDSSLQDKLHALEENLSEKIAHLNQQRRQVQTFLAEERSLEAFDRSENQESLTHQFLLETLTEYAAHTPEGIRALDKKLLAQLDAFKWGEEYRAYWQRLSQALSDRSEPLQKANQLFASAADLEIDDPQLEILAEEIAGQLQELQPVLSLPNFERSLQCAFMQVVMQSVDEILTPTQKHLIGLLQQRLHPTTS